MSMFKPRAKNILLNGNMFARNRRGSQSQLVADGTTSYHQDKWRCTAINIAQNFDTQGDTINGKSVLMLYNQAVWTNANQVAQVEQRVESLYTKNLKDKLSYGFYVKSFSATQVEVRIHCPDVLDNWSGTGTTYVHTFAVPNNGTLTFISMENLALPTNYQNGLGFRVSFKNMGVLASAIHLIGEVMLCESEVVQPFDYCGDNELHERQLLKRYYRKSYEDATPRATATSVNEYVFWCATAVSTRQYFGFGEPMRVAPTMTFWNRNGSLGVWLDTASAVRSVDTYNSFTHGFSMDVTPGAVNRYVLGHWEAEADL